MSLNLDQYFEMVAKKLEVSQAEHKIFMSDTSALVTWINGALKASNSMFADNLANLPATATYMSGNIIDVPDKFNCYLLVDLKCALSTEVEEEAYIYLHADSIENATGESQIVSASVQFYLSDVLRKMMSTDPIVNCNGRSYQLCYHTSIHPISSHTIIATQLKTPISNYTRIVFEFFIAIKVPITKTPRPLCVPLSESLPGRKMNFWLAHPVTHVDAKFNARSFFGKAHVWQMASNEQRQRWRQAVRLSYMMSIAISTTSTIGLHALKHSCINYCEDQGMDRVKRPLSLMVMDMMKTHGSSKIMEMYEAQQSGQIVNIEAHPNLLFDCSKTDVMLETMKETIEKKYELDLDRVKFIFGLKVGLSPKQEEDNKGNLN